MSFADNLAAVDLQVRQKLGEPVIYTPSAGSPVTVQGVFDDVYVTVQAGEGQAGISSSGPAVFLAVSDLPTDPEHDDFTITRPKNSRSYKPWDRNPDGMGGVLIHLHQL